MHEPTLQALTSAKHPHTMDLKHGGQLSLSEHDGDYQLRIDVDGGHFAIRVNAIDVWEFRNMTNRIIAGRASEAVS